MQTQNSVGDVDNMTVHTISRAPGTPFSCMAGDTLLSGALRAGIGIAYECNAGGCGSCKVALLDGEVHDLQPTAAGIKPRERERGKILACQCVPLSPCTISFREDEELLPRILPRPFSAQFTESRSITHDLWEFTFRAGSAAEFLPGQYALLSLPGIDERRSYSMSNLPNSDGIWQFQVRRVPGGLATRVLFEELAPGSVCMIDAPYSNAYLRTEIQRDIVCIAGGSGLAPMLSVVRGALTSTELQGVPIHLYYGGREPRDIFSLELFHDLVRERLQFVPVVSCDRDALGDWSGETGFLHECISQRLQGRFAQCEFYVAGPPPMVEAVRKLLILEQGVAAERIHYDRFF